MAQRLLDHRQGHAASKYLEMTEQASEAARRLASLRRVYKKACPVCGTEFEGIAKRIYDRSACQVRAYRLRKKELSARRMDLDQPMDSEA